ncbi:gamma-glutamylcyclotransferase [Chitiniphilus purpureus]|uniref:Gamma-glutamylcyclotransferase family protein n=1 Tax=Chitiniphilus purpureus TaxID=2981137 RepID=A0ABY6DJJ4_9NEIS|nr:gamma-glutamylcyclotransferase family protein [Chitiniphilus sp. CD1]UXY14527.1 gamma-glutamylcyclotransferase [Chitiniphilus sp. CD1]
MSGPVPVFVYGTLKRGGWNHRWLNGAPCLGEAVTVECYSLYAHHYPFLVCSEPRYPVRGELYAVDAATLRNLDELEGHPHDYMRQQIAVHGPHGPMQAWAYCHDRPQGTLLAEGVFSEAAGAAGLLCEPVPPADPRRSSSG